MMPPGGSSFQNSTSSGVGGGDSFAGGRVGPRMGSMYAGEAASGLNLSSPAILMMCAVAAFYVLGRK